MQRHFHGAGTSIAWTSIVVALVLIVGESLASPEVAHQFYMQALGLVQENRFAEAKVAFERAYRESPHHSVLYNLGKVSLELGEGEAARDYFERYLKEGGSALPEARRQEIVELLQRIADASAKTGSEEAAVPVSQPPAVVAAAAPRAPQALRTRASGRPRSDDADANRVSAVRLDRFQHETAAKVLGGTGLTLLGTALVLAIWNENRNDQAKEQRAALSATAPSEALFAVDQRTLDALLQHERALAQNEAAFDSVRDFDYVAGATAITGAALLATGIVLYVVKPKGSDVLAGGRRVALRLSF